MKFTDRLLLVRRPPVVVQFLSGMIGIVESFADHGDDRPTNEAKWLLLSGREWKDRIRPGKSGRARRAPFLPQRNLCDHFSRLLIVRVHQDHVHVAIVLGLNADDAASERIPADLVSGPCAAAWNHARTSPIKNFRGRDGLNLAAVRR